MFHSTTAKSSTSTPFPLNPTTPSWIDDDLDTLNSYCYIAAVTYPSSLAQYQLDRIALLESRFPISNYETDRLLRKLDKRYWKYIWQRANAIRKHFLITRLVDIDPAVLYQEFQQYLDSPAPSWP